MGRGVQQGVRHAPGSAALPVRGPFPVTLWPRATNFFSFSQVGRRGEPGGEKYQLDGWVGLGRVGRGLALGQRLE
jgi:hypothetical protein